MMNLSPEETLLLCLARTNVGGEATREMRAVLHRELDWESFVERAEHGRIAPLAYWNLRKTGMTDVVPDAVMETFRQDYCATLYRNTIRFKELSDVLRVFESNGIEVILLKGAALATMVYPDPGLRPMGDIDLLVTENKGPIVHEVLSNLGYRTFCPIPTRWHLTWQEHLPGYFRQRGSVKIMLEIHLGLGTNARRLGFGRMDLESVYQDATRLEITGSSTLRLGPEDLLLHLCIHTSRDLYQHKSRLIQWCDIAMVQRYYRSQLDWEQVIRKAKTYCMETYIYDCLQFIEAYWGISPPGIVGQVEVGKWLVPPEYMAASVMRGDPLMDYSPHVHTYGGRHYQRIALLFETNGLLGKIRFILHSLFPSPGYIEGLYAIGHPALVYVYYLVRIGQRVSGLAMDFWFICRAHFVASAHRSGHSDAVCRSAGSR